MLCGRNLCCKLCKIMKPGCNGVEENGFSKTLSAPVQLREAAEGFENNTRDMESIWLMQKNYSLVRYWNLISSLPATADDSYKMWSLQKVDQKKLAKATAKQQQKQEKRDSSTRVAPANPVSSQMSSASASQVTSKKEAKMEAKGNNRSQDIRIENFDLSFGDRSVTFFLRVSRWKKVQLMGSSSLCRVLLQNADLTLSFGRRYGLVGRNGLGKTTLLRMISRYLCPILVWPNTLNANTGNFVFQKKTSSWDWYYDDWAVC